MSSWPVFGLPDVPPASLEDLPVVETPDVTIDLTTKLVRRDPRIRPQLLLDPSFQRIELRYARWPLVPRRHLALECATNRVAMPPRPTMNLTNRDTLDPMQPPDLGPLLHADDQPLLA